MRSFSLFLSLFSLLPMCVYVYFSFYSSFSLYPCFLSLYYCEHFNANKFICDANEKDKMNNRCAMLKARLSRE